MRRGGNIFEITDEPLGYDGDDEHLSELSLPGEARAPAPGFGLRRAAAGACVVLTVIAVAVVASSSSGPQPAREATDSGDVAPQSEAAVPPSSASRAISKREAGRRPAEPHRPTLQRSAPYASTAPARDRRAGSVVTAAPTRVVVVLRTPAPRPAPEVAIPAVSEAEREFGFER